MSAEEFTTTPVMHVMRALVKEPDGYLIPPPEAQHGTIAIGAGPVPGVGGALYVGVQAPDGRLLVAILPENKLRELSDNLMRAARAIQTGQFETATVEGATVQ